MAHVKLRTYFVAEASGIVLPPDTQLCVQSCVQRCEQTIKTLLSERKIVLGQLPTDLNSLTQDLKKKLNFDLEEQIKQDQLKEARRQEEVLKSKLEQVQDNIHGLEPVNTEKKPTRLRLLSRDVRTQVQELEDAKVKEAKAFAAKLIEEQRLLDHHRQQFIESVSVKVAQESETAAKAKAELEKAKEDKKQARVQELKTLTAKRQQQLEEIKEVLKTSKVKKLSVSLYASESPIHKHNLSEDHMSLKELLHEHLQKYSEAKRTYESRRFQQLIAQKLSSSAQTHKSAHYFFDVAAEKRFQQQEKEQKLQQKEELLNKKKRYATLVKEMYAPVADREKQLELEKMKARVHTLPRVSRPIDRSARPQSLVSVSNGESMESENSAGIRKPKSVQMREEMRKIKRIDYLSAVRNLRIQQESNGKEGNVSLRNLSSQLTGEKTEIMYKANLLERKALQKAKILQAGDLTDMRNLQQVDDVDSALVSSVRAKLGLLSC